MLPNNATIRPRALQLEITQRYYFDPTFGGALVPGQRNVLTATEDLTGIAFFSALADSRLSFPRFALTPHQESRLLAA